MVESNRDTVTFNSSIHYFYICVHITVLGVRMSMESLRRRLQSVRLRAGDTETATDSVQPALLLIDLELCIPRITMQPSLEETQTAITRVVQTMLAATETVTQWEHLAKQQLQIQKVRDCVFVCLRAVVLRLHCYN